ncbi:MAG TPA: hypothetical protein VIO61_10890 [Anaerolineaceae bacterium]
MERTVPSTISEEIRLYRTTIYSLLRSTTEVQIRTLEEVHSGMNSLLHPNARSPIPDISAFIYSLLRLPDCISQVRLVVLGQSQEVFKRNGYDGVEGWEPVTARARRRRCFYNGRDLLAAYIASRSDIEDMIPTLTAFQIEWNKLNALLRDYAPEEIHKAVSGEDVALQRLSLNLNIATDDLARLFTIWGKGSEAYLLEIAQRRISFRLRLLSGSLTEYRRATNEWWENIEKCQPLVSQRPIYFVSSNTHSIINPLTGFALQHKEELIQFLNENNADLLSEWNDIQSQMVNSSQENFLYYVMKKYQGTNQGKRLLEDQKKAEEECGICRIAGEHSFDVEAQVIEINRLKPELFDPRLNGEDWACLKNSEAVILNIDYPLGSAAYNILTKVAERGHSIRGVYVMGKAATLNGRRGDIMIPNVVQDEHSQNTYLFPNVFSAADVTPFLVYGTVLDNQKSITVFGTFLQDAQIMDVFYKEGYADIEMEAGPYLSAVFEMARPQRHPVDEIVNLYHLPFDLGILHYASDTPLSKGRNLGAGTLSYYGMDSTYAASLAILRRIFRLEKNRTCNVT